VLLLSSLPAAAGEQAGFKVIAHPSVAGATVSRAVLGAVFLGRVERWGNGTRIVPVDLSAMSSIRGAFSETVLGMPTVAVRRYWEQRLMSAGGTPPMVKGSDEAVIEAVAGNAGAIGYVSAETSIPETVRVLAVQ
jgi:ABC-type phosphate transport system substrate-binding protein